MLRRTARACSASERYAELITSEIPARRAAAAIRSKASGDVGAHRPCPAGRRAVPSSRRRWPSRASRRSARVPVRRRLGLGAGLDPDGAAGGRRARRPTVRAAPEARSRSTDAVTSARTRSGAKESASGNETRSRSGSTPFRAAACARRLRRSRQVLAPVQVTRVRRSAGKPRRREQPREVVSQRACAGERDQVRGALRPGRPGERAPERHQQRGREQDRERRAEHHQQRLASLRGRRAGPADQPASEPAARAWRPRHRSPGRPCARREATRPSGREATRAARRRSRSSATASAASGRSLGRSARSSPAAWPQARLLQGQRPQPGG